MKFPFFKKKVKNEAVIDLGKLKEIENRHRALKEATLASTSSEQDFGFLGTLAAAASSDSQTQTQFASSSPKDIEKIERLDRRIDRVIERIELMERKIERIERRIDLKY
ncbi:MAG: hypothetical protein QXK80_01375 [Candidatus Pacearchaeota archaeon]